MEKERITRYLEKAACELDLKPDGPLSYGWQCKSAGCRAVNIRGEAQWLRVIAWPLNVINERVWFGWKSTAAIQGVQMPTWIRDYEWDEAEMRCRADVLEFVKDPPVSSAPELRSKIRLPNDWFESLRRSLENLHTVSTERVCVRQDLVTRRLQERYGGKVDTIIGEWEPSHGDLHWANLTAPHCWLLDWEAWGIAPKGFDAALLYCFSLQQPEIASLIHDTFKDWLVTPTGIKAQMFACAELIRMTELYADHPKLHPLLIQLASALAKSI